MIKFYPTQDFVSQEFQSAYLRGLSYTATDDNPRLLAAIQRWAADGIVSFEQIEVSLTPIELRGAGLVSAPTQED